MQTLSKCSKVDVCKCSTDEGTIDLWSLDGTGSNIPRFDYDLDLWPVNISRLGPKEISHLDNRALKKGHSVDNCVISLHMFSSNTNPNESVVVAFF